MKKNRNLIILCVVLVAGLAAPLVTGASDPGFYIEVLLGGLMAGVLYSLVALGFVLIYKASGVFNFAQGAMVLFAALSVARLAEVDAAVAGQRCCRGRHHGGAGVACIERLVLRPLVNQDRGGAADGDAGHHLFSERLRPDHLGQRHLQDRPRHRQGAGDDPAERVRGRHPDQQGRRRGGGGRRRCWWSCWPCSSRRPRPDARCARSPTITRRRSRSAFR